MKRLLPHALVVALICAACATTSSTDPTQKAIDLLYSSYTTLDQAIQAADVAVKTNQLKGAAAVKADAGFRLAKSGLDASLSALKASIPASGVKP